MNGKIYMYMAMYSDEITHYTKRKKLIKYKKETMRERIRETTNERSVNLKKLKKRKKRRDRDKRRESLQRRVSGRAS